MNCGVILQARAHVGGRYVSPYAAREDRRIRKPREISILLTCTLEALEPQNGPTLNTETPNVS